MTKADEFIAQVEKQLGEITPGPWKKCFHLQSQKNDESCPCGFPGDIWGADGEHVICTMGPLIVPGQEAMSPPRYDRPIELANAQFIAQSPETIRRLTEMLKVAKTALTPPRDYDASFALSEIERIAAGGEL